MKKTAWESEDANRYGERRGGAHGRKVPDAGERGRRKQGGRREKTASVSFVDLRRDNLDIERGIYILMS